ncbi:MAG: nicotinate-nucleotide adenylyltransferase [candidate division WOR-3 bacterium]|nr:nicotinate-nucleotide adenylyltransferase [candidate division WOR-3 bacterium]
MPLRLGVFGGSFNPIHLGHLLVAEDVRRRLRLDRVLFVPTCRPPHKHGPMTHYHHRLAMTRLAIAGEPGFELCRIEELRPGRSYTVDTLARLKVLYPGAALCLVLGSDQYQEISGWYRPQMLARLARLVVMSRPGTAQPALFPGHDPRRVLFRAVIQVAVSAKLVRARLAKGHSVRYMLPVKVSEYVTRHHLYRRPKVSAG